MRSRDFKPFAEVICVDDGPMRMWATGWRTRFASGLKKGQLYVIRDTHRHRLFGLRVSLRDSAFPGRLYAPERFRPLDIHPDLTALLAPAGKELPLATER